MSAAAADPELVPDANRAGLWPLLALALGGFGIGLTEFIASGLLPQIAHDLLRKQYDTSSSAAVGHAGWLISTYAAGVVVGAPLVAFGAARVERKRLVLGLLVLFVIGTAASAAAPTFATLLAARFVAGLPHGAYFGAAGLLASSIMGPGRHARGFAVVLSGLTVANVGGVPLVTRLGQVTSWRVAYLAIAAVFAVTLVAVLLVVPATTTRPDSSPRAELGAFRSARVWLIMATIAIGFSGFFAVDTYVAPMTTRLAGLSSTAVPWVLVALGLGMTTGNALGGWFSDRNVTRSLLVGFPVFIAALTVCALIAANPVGLFVSIYAVSATALFLVPAMQALLIAIAPGAVLMGAAMNQAATNVANSLGAAIGAVVIGHGLGYRAPAWVGVALAFVGWVMALLILRPRACESIHKGPD